MDTLVKGGKYKVLEVLVEQGGYKACLCIDVETNNHYRPMIFNIYENDKYIRRFLPAFYSMDHEQHSDFIHVMSGHHSITAAFEHHSGVKLESYFRQADKEDFELRLKFAHMLLEECMILDTVEDFIAFPCLDPENIVISEKSQKVMVNYIIRPVEDTGGEFKGQKLAALLDCIFVKNRYVPDALWKHIEDLRQGRGISIVGAFSRWKELQVELLEQHIKLKKETLAQYLIRRLKGLKK